jgi:hypothetical protein
MVTSASAPLLGELEDDDPPEEVIRQGELVKVIHEIRPFHWDAKMDGVESHREGKALEVKYADEGAAMFAFQPDFGAEVSVPVTSWLCSNIAGQGAFDVSRCPALLRRARTEDGALLIYAACNTGTCPVGVLRDGKLAVIPIENLTSASFFLGKKRSLLVAQTRWTKEEGKQSGGAYVPIVIEGGVLTRKDEIATDRVDARDPQKMLARLVHARVSAGEITITGEETVKTIDGATVSTKQVDEKHPLPSLD